ncbi:MAG: ATP-binding protein [Bacteroidota bacterium]
MYRRVEEWFTDRALRKTPSILERKRIVLLTRLLFISILLICFMLLLQYDNTVQVTHYSILIVFLSLALLSVRRYKSIELASYCIITLATGSLLLLLLFTYRRVDNAIILLMVNNVTFSFYFLKYRGMMIFSIFNILPVIVCLYLFNNGVSLLASPITIPEASSSEIYLITLSIVALVVLALWNYRQSFNLSFAMLEEALQEQKQLTHQYQELSTELAIAKDKAEEMYRLKSSFLSNMSHEIRTPLNGIMGIAQLIDAETQDDNIKEYVTIQQRSGERLMNTISSILRLSRIEAEKVEITLQRVSIHELIQENVETLEVLASQKGVTLTFVPFSKPLICQADEDMINQVLSNILGNAIKFTDEGEVSVHTGIKDIEAGTLYIRVKDTGLGMSAEFTERLFQPFTQESTGTKREYEGTGLGLSIAKQYCELLDGTILVESVKGEGSTFEIVLPLAENKTEEVGI